MLDEAELKQAAMHKKMHDMGLCICPCMDMLLKVGAALKMENDLRVKMARVSPEALAALTIGAASMDSSGDSPDEDADEKYTPVNEKERLAQALRDGDMATFTAAARAANNPWVHADENLDAMHDAVKIEGETYVNYPHCGECGNEIKKK